MTRERSSVYWLGYLFSIVLCISISGCGNSKKHSFETAVAANLNASKQEWFDAFHPVGTATRITLHAANRIQTPQGPQADVRFTLYWSGPITSDGFTKIHAIYDGESDRWVGAEILETNGVTNAQTAEGIGAAIGALLSE